MTIQRFIILLFICVLLTSAKCEAKHQFRESEYQAYWCGRHNGIMEYKLPDKTRVDCLTDNLAVEFDFAKKWAECLGQAQFYGQMTRRQPACALIIEDPEHDAKYLKRLRYVAYKKGIRTFTITPDKLNRLILSEVAETVIDDSTECK